MTTLCTAPRHPDDDRPDTRPHGALCLPCERGLARDLRRLPALDHKLSIIAILRAAPGNGSVPLPFDEDISDWQSWFRRAVTRATITIAGIRRWRLPADHPWAMCAWLEPQVTWMSLKPWAPGVADVFHRIRTKGELLADPLQIARVFIPAPCLDCGNGRMDAVIYVDHHQGKWSYWVCPQCRTATQIECWWDYPKRLAAMRQEAG